VENQQVELPDYNLPTNNAGPKSFRPCRNLIYEVVGHCTRCGSPIWAPKENSDGPFVFMENYCGVVKSCCCRDFTDMSEKTTIAVDTSPLAKAIVFATAVFGALLAYWIYHH
jgi:hypothetical protein